MGSQVSPTIHRILVLVKGDRQMGSQVSPTTQRYWFWLKGIAGRDLRLAQPHRILVLVQGDRPMGSQVKKKKEKEIENRKKRARSLDE
jgi:hypothetical protein